MQNIKAGLLNPSSYCCYLRHPTELTSPNTPSPTIWRHNVQLHTIKTQFLSCWC